jgi:hypothetical protein
MELEPLCHELSAELAEALFSLVENPASSALPKSHLEMRFRVAVCIKSHIAVKDIASTPFCRSHISSGDGAEELRSGRKYPLLVSAQGREGSWKPPHPPQIDRQIEIISIAPSPAR